MIELASQQREEKEETTKKVRIPSWKVEVAEMAATTDRKPEEGRPVTRDGENRDLRVWDDSKVAETQGLQASMHANTSQEGTTHPSDESSAA